MLLNCVVPAHTLGVVLEFEGWLELPSGLCTVKKSRAPGISLLTRNVFTEAAFSPDFTVEAVMSVSRSWYWMVSGLDSRVGLVPQGAAVARHNRRAFSRDESGVSMES